MRICTPFLILICNLSLLGLLGGCEVGPNYRRPDIALKKSYPASLQKGTEGMSEEALAHWWTVFDDPVLNSLVSEAIAGNRDLKVAQSRVRQARAQRAMVSSGLLPEADVTGGYDRARGSKNVVIPFGALEGAQGGAPAGGAASGGGATRSIEQAPAGGGGGSAAAGPPEGGPSSPFGEGGLPGVTTSLYQAGFDASWEVDVFGGTRRAIEAADAEVGASEEARRGVLISVLGDVAGTYVQLRTDQRRLEIARQNLAAGRDALDIAVAKFHTGFATRLDVKQQTAQVLSIEASIPALESAERDGEHTLAFLCGKDPDAFVALLAPAHDTLRIPPAIPPGVPSDLLRRRPDIREAERNLAAATAQVGVATAALFPSFSLTGVFGWDSSAFKNLPDWSSHYYSISPGVYWPILDWGRMRANIRASDEAQEQSLLQYETTVARALQDVEDALVHCDRERARRVSLESAAAASHDAWKIARLAYERGVTDMVASLDAQRTYLQAEDALAQSDGALRADLIALYKALGGGWE